MLNFRKRGNGHAVKAVEDEIAATRQAGLDAITEAERLETAGAAELDDEKSEDLLRQGRAQRRAAKRAELRLVELRGELASVKFDRDRVTATLRIAAARRLGREAVEAIAKAGDAMAAYVANRELALAQLGGIAERLIPPVAFCGIVHAHHTQPWRIDVERVLSQLDRAELPKPPPPPAPRPIVPDAERGVRPAALSHGDAGKGGPVRLRPLNGPAGREPSSTLPPTVDNAHGRVSLSAEPVHRPRQVRPLRRDPAPGDGEAQLLLMRGDIELPDGSLSIAGDVVNMDAQAARLLVLRGAADFHNKDEGEENDNG